MSMYMQKVHTYQEELKTSQLSTPHAEGFSKFHSVFELIIHQQIRIKVSFNFSICEIYLDLYDLRTTVLYLFSSKNMQIGDIGVRTENTKNLTFLNF